MFFKSRPDKALAEVRKQANDTSGVTLHQSDDLLQRAKNIVHHLGYRGAVGDFVLGVYDVLKAYDTLDNGDIRGDLTQLPHSPATPQAAQPSVPAASESQPHTPGQTSSPPHSDA